MLRSFQRMANINTKRVTQRRRSRGRIIQLKQTHYVPKSEEQTPLPISLLSSGSIRRMIYSKKAEAAELIPKVDWDKYKCDVRGVRWHPMGGWRVQFDRRDYEHNFYVKCSMYFRVSIYGFDKAKELAINYRKRLGLEWDEQQKRWNELDMEDNRIRLEKRRQRAQLADASTSEGPGFLDTIENPEAVDQGRSAEAK